MKNSKLVEEAKLNPGRIYSRPQDVLRDRRLKDAERLEILTAWEQVLQGAEPGPDGAAALESVLQARREIEARLHTLRAAE